MFVDSNESGYLEQLVFTWKGTNGVEEPALAFPAGNKIIDDSLKLARWDNHVILSSFRVPLATFSGVDLSDVRSAALVFDATDSGAIFLADLELLRVQ